MASLAPGSPGAKDEARPASIRSGSSRQWTPEQYTSSITAYANQRGNTLYPGVHFSKLAHLLRKPFDTSARRTPRNYTPATDFATLYQYIAGGAVEVSEPKTPEELAQLAETEASSILFLRGQPCPEWLVYAGTSYHIDPEFFYRHLDFLSNLLRKRYFAQPSLISASRNIIQLTYMTVGEFPSHFAGLSQSKLDALRESANNEVLEYINGLGKKILKSASGSESIVRAYHVLDERHFAIEQQASVFLGQTEKGWGAVVWLDTGRPLTPSQPGPWSKSIHDNQIMGQETFLPWIQAHPFSSLHAASKSITHDRRPSNSDEWSKYLQQSASLLHLDYGKSLIKEIVPQDPFYALNELFTSCAYSEVQFLNVIESKLNEDTSREPVPDLNVSPANMIYFQGLLDRQADSLRRTISAIESRDDSGWPRPPDSTMRKKSSAAANSLLQDYNGLLKRTETLSNHCKSRLQILMSRAGIVESNKAIEQAKEVTKLTRLAFVFVPLSFVSSFFGMNLTPLVEAPYSLWLFFAVSAPLVTLLVASMTWSFSHMVKAFSRKGQKEPPKVVELDDLE